jgi:hypothetical protein
LHCPVPPHPSHRVRRSMELSIPTGVSGARPVPNAPAQRVKLGHDVDNSAVTTLAPGVMVQRCSWR